MTTSTTPRARLPRTLAGLSSHPWVESVSDERGTGAGIWVYLKPGYVTHDCCHTIHESTVKECCRAFRFVWHDPEDYLLEKQATPAPAEAAPAPAPRRRLNPLAEMLLMRLQATDQDWLVFEVSPVIGSLRDLGWIVTRHDYGAGVECQITIHGRHALAARPCDGDAAPAPRPTLPGEATPPPAPSHGEAAPTLPELCPGTPGTPTRAEAVQDVERRDGGGVAVICSDSPREAFRLPDTVSLCGAAAALEAAGWILSPELEGLARRWRDISGDQDPSPEAVAIAEAAAPRLKRFEVFHRTWWRAEGVPGVGESHHIGWASTEARARYMCRRWNASHAPGPLSDRAEYTAA